jgi:hypothetical protein
MTKTYLNAIRRWPTPEAEQWVTAFSLAISSNTSVLALIAFGSAVRSEDYCADVDLLVIYKRIKPNASSRPVEVDIRWHEILEAERLIAEGHELLCWVVSFGELICERDHYWTNLCDHWQGRMPFPSAEIAVRRAARAELLLSELEAMGDLDEAHEQFMVVLTQRARAALIRHHVYPASRPELPNQLRGIGETELADRLEETLRQRETV